MSQNVPVEAEKSLTPKQQEVIGLLVRGSTITEAAQRAGVNEKTVDRWKKLAHFQATLHQAEDALFSEAVSKLKSTMSDAINCLIRNMKDPVTPYVQVQAAKTLLEQAVNVQKIAELEGKIAAFEALMKEAGI